MKEIAETIQYNIRREIENAQKNKQCLLVAIDGRCASGKTTLAKCLQKIYGCDVIHMDHFFLRPEQINEQRLSEPGGNVDYERFLDEVLLPLKNKKSFAYRPYDCKKQEMTEAIPIKQNTITLIEGSYCCHPKLFEHYDVKIFLTVNEKKRIERIKARNGEAGCIQFRDKWIPLEECYFTAFNIEACCDYSFET